MLNNIEMRVNNEPVDTVKLDPAELDAFFAKPTVSYPVTVTNLELYLPFHYEASYDDRMFFYQLDKLELYGNPNILFNIELENHIHPYGNLSQILLIQTDDPTAIAIEGLKSQLTDYDIVYFDDHSVIFEDSFRETNTIYFKYLPEQTSFLIYISEESFNKDIKSNQTERIKHNLKKIRMAKNLLADKTSSSPTWDDYWESLSNVERKVLFSATNQLKAIIDDLDDNKTYHFETYQEECLFSLTTDQKKIAAVMNGAKKLPTNPQTTVLAEEIFGQNTISPFMHILTDEIKVISSSKNGFTLFHKPPFNKNRYGIFHQTEIHDRQVLLFNGCVDTLGEKSYQYHAQLKHVEMAPFYVYFFENIHKFLTDEITLEIK